ncbi:hypothetical protein [Vreelandella sp. EE22]
MVVSTCEGDQARQKSRQVTDDAFFAGMPAGVQIAGRRGEDWQLMQLAYALEQQENWQKHLPWQAFRVRAG